MNSFQFPYIAEEDLYKEVEWLQEAIVYQIFPDRFHNINPSIDIGERVKFIEEVFMLEIYVG